MVTNSETKIFNSRESIEMPIGNFVDCNIMYEQMQMVKFPLPQTA
jgi:hypothetical protein